VLASGRKADAWEVRSKRRTASTRPSERSSPGRDFPFKEREGTVTLVGLVEEEILKEKIQRSFPRASR